MTRDCMRVFPISFDIDLVTKKILLPEGVIQFYSHEPTYVWTDITGKILTILPMQRWLGK